MSSVTGELIHLRERIKIFENSCLKAVCELTKPNPQIGPALLQLNKAILQNDRILNQYNKLTHK
jgi:hypothetical protein